MSLSASNLQTLLQKWEPVLSAQGNTEPAVLIESQECFDYGHWTLKEGVSCIDDKELPYGFIYVITNKLNGRGYIGKKQILTTRKRPPLKGKKRKRSFVLETDWKTYTSSSNEVNEDILKHGKENFIFEIVRWCNSKSALAYYEAKLQFEHDVLLNENFYNGIINLRIGKIKCT